MLWRDLIPYYIIVSRVERRERYSYICVSMPSTYRITLHDNPFIHHNIDTHIDDVLFAIPPNNSNGGSKDDI